MKLQLEANAKDSDMIEATYKWANGRKVEQTLLAFVLHVDCLDEFPIKQRLEDGQVVTVEIKVV